MGRDRRRDKYSRHEHDEDELERGGLSPGKRTLTQGLVGPRHPAAPPVDVGKRTSTQPLASDADDAHAPERPPTLGIAHLFERGALQRKRAAGAPEPSGPDAVAAARAGVADASAPLPFAELIQRAFGRHDIAGVRVTIGGAARAASEAIGARAFTYGERIAFGESPDLHTAAHEAAHVVQQRRGVSVSEGVGTDGDPYERHADAVADAVVAGRPAESLLDAFAGSGSAAAVVQRGALPKPTEAGVPARGDYDIYLPEDGSFRLRFNSTDLRAVPDPAAHAFRLYVLFYYPTATDAIVADLTKEFRIGFARRDPIPVEDDRSYEVNVPPELHEAVVFWFVEHHPKLPVSHGSRTTGAANHVRDAGRAGGNTGAAITGVRGGSDAPKPPPAPPKSPAQQVAEHSVDDARELLEQFKKLAPDDPSLRGARAWPDVLAWLSEHLDEIAQLKRTGRTIRSLDVDQLKRLLEAFHQHVESSERGDLDGAFEDGRDNGKVGGSKDGGRWGDLRGKRDGSKSGSIYGEDDGVGFGGWIQWVPKGAIVLTPQQDVYVAGASIKVELAWDESVHPRAGLIVLPHHCDYLWTLRHSNGTVVDDASNGVFSDARTTSLDTADKMPGTYTIEVAATSGHFGKLPRKTFVTNRKVQVLSEKQAQQRAFDAAHVDGKDATFTRDDKGALQVRPGQQALTVGEELRALDLTKGGVDALAAQGKISETDRDVLDGQLGKQRDALVEIGAATRGATPYIVRGTFTSREDSTSLALKLLMHAVVTGDADGEAHHGVILHDLTFGEPTRHPGSSHNSLDGEVRAQVLRLTETEALDEMADHFHAHNDYPKGTVHLAVQLHNGGAVWEKSLDTNNTRKKLKKAVGTVAMVGGVAMLFIPGGASVTVSVGVMAVTTTAGVAGIALEIEDRYAKRGKFRFDRQLVTDVLQLAAMALPFGGLTKTLQNATALGKTGFQLCLTAVDAAQGFLLAADVRQQLQLIDANTAVALASVTDENVRAAILKDRDRQIAEILGGAIVNGTFLLVSLGAGLKVLHHLSRTGRAFDVREPIRDIAAHGSDAIKRTLADGWFMHGDERVAINSEERTFLEQELVISSQPTVGPEPHEPSHEPTSHEHATEASHDETSKPGHERTAAPEANHPHEGPQPEHEPTSHPPTTEKPAHESAGEPKQPEPPHPTESHPTDAPKPSEPHVEPSPPHHEPETAQQRSERVRHNATQEIRGEKELSSADVAFEMNHQLQRTSSSDIDTIVEGLPGDARTVLVRSTGFASMESLNPLRSALEPHLAGGGMLFTPGRGSLADSVAYIASKGSFTTHPKKIKTTTNIHEASVVILDDVVLSLIRDGGEVATALRAEKAPVMLQPRGFTDGVNLFHPSSPDAIRNRIRGVLDHARAIAERDHLAFDEAVSRALDERARIELDAAHIAAKPEVVDPAHVPELTNEAIAQQLNGNAGVTAEQIDAALAKVAEADRPLLRELLAQQAEVFSPHRIANELRELHAKHLEIADRHHIDHDNIFYFIYDSKKSYSVIDMAHRQVTGTKVDHYINGSTELATRHLQPDTMLVVLDDFAGTGGSLEDAAAAISGTRYPGQIVLSPMASTHRASERLMGAGGLGHANPNSTYVPARTTPALAESPLYRSLSPQMQEHLKQLLVQLGYGDTGSSIAFPHMAPNNNNTMFGDQLAKEFILNKNRKAAKGRQAWDPPKGGSQ